MLIGKSHMTVGSLPTPFMSPFRSLIRSQRRHWSSFTRTQDAVSIDAVGTFPFRWLRDSCLSPDCVHPSTSQKLHRSSDIAANVQPTSEGIQLSTNGLRIRWTDGHESVFPKSFLERHASREKLRAFHDDAREQPWTKNDIAGSSSLFVSYESLAEKSGLRTAIDQLTSRGLLFVTGVPNEETSDEKCELRTLAERFSYIRETFYGPVWDVVNLRDSKNIAYTNLDLGLHMDLLYFKHPPKYQILHCLRNRVEGGSSIFVDAFHAAEQLRADAPEHFTALTNTLVPFHYINDGHHLHYEHPTIEISSTGAIEQINYSPPFQAPLFVDTPPIFYDALAAFAKLLGDESRTFVYTLKEGDAVVFDNRRVLHARTAFYEREGASEADGQPNRWLKGCYFEADALLDRRRILRKV
ncbi:Glycoside hydrolase family 5 protein [Mycena chlorophos]|uniref:Glycoside hydrolase family 5 protein n=1 Tax=Mycena chlorophos TaxID=658473 RepID=A0A8H6TMX8_MYCCL|nr:Glycoside hydrolase family 5 protein [Mycena chlorophos]